MSWWSMLWGFWCRRRGSGFGLALVWALFWRRDVTWGAWRRRYDTQVTKSAVCAHKATSESPWCNPAGRAAVGHAGRAPCATPFDVWLPKW